jgi:hypothetical protein
MPRVARHIAGCRASLQRTYPPVRGRSGQGGTVGRLGTSHWRRETRRRRMRWVLAATLVLLTGCGSRNVESSQRHDPPGAIAASQHPTTQAVAQQASCPRPRTTLILGHRHLRVPPSGGGPRRVTMHVGNRMLVRTAGICAAAVEGSPQNAGLRAQTNRHSSHVRVTSFEAAHAGVVRLVMSMPMCARPGRLPPPQCRGGIRLLGTAVVTVKALGLPR